MSTMISLLIFEGEYDLSLRKRIRQDLDVVRYDECLIIDLSTVSYCEASCLAEFVLLARDRHERRALPAMIVPSPVMKRLFEITHVDSHFTILEAVEDGVRDDNAAVSVHGAPKPAARVHCGIISPCYRRNKIVAQITDTHVKRRGQLICRSRRRRGFASSLRGRKRNRDGAGSRARRADLRGCVRGAFLLPVRLPGTFDLLSAHVRGRWEGAQSKERKLLNDDLRQGARDVGHQAAAPFEQLFRARCNAALAHRVCRRYQCRISGSAEREGSVVVA
jgi:anti-anti-sigma regulatory factor